MNVCSVPSPTAIAMSSAALDLRLAAARRVLAETSQHLGVLLPAPRAPGGRTRATVVPTGIAPLDLALHGGLPRGRISELSGARSSGRMAVTLHLLSHASAAGEPVALVDAADALEPDDLSADERARTLWVRPGDLHAALRCADLVLDGGGFALVALYLVGAPPSTVLARGVPASAWARLAQRAAGANAALLVVTDGDPRFRPGAFAAVGLAVERRRARWVGGAPLLDGVEAELMVRRMRGGAAPAEGFRWGDEAPP